jgi:hypothetical protein
VAAPADTQEVQDDATRTLEIEGAAGTTRTETDYTVPEANELPGFSETDLAKLEAQTGNPFVDLANGNVPLGNLVVEGVWSLSSLIFVLLALVNAARVLPVILRRRREEALQQAYASEDASGRGRGRALGWLTVVLGVATLILWWLLDDLSHPMAWVNRWTTPVGVTFLVQVAVNVLYERAGRAKRGSDGTKGQAA